MRIGSIGFLCLLTCVAVFAAPARSDTTLGCGSVVTESVVLDHDIGPCAADGIIVRGDAVTVDLNGHRIRGSAGSGTGVGIVGDDLSPVGHVRVTNGGVTGFGQGVSVATTHDGCSASSTITVDELRIRANGSGINAFVTCAVTVTFQRNQIEANDGDGIRAGLNGGPIHILDNQVLRNAGTGIRGMFDSVRRVEGNLVAHNGGDGIHLEDTVSTVNGNFMLQNGGIGLVIRETVPSFIPDYEVSDNVANRNDGGGMTASSFPAPPGPPAGDGNSAKKNGNFQCVLIVCAKNRGHADDMQP